MFLDPVKQDLVQKSKPSFSPIVQQRGWIKRKCNKSTKLKHSVVMKVVVTSSYGPVLLLKLVNIKTDEIMQMDCYLRTPQHDPKQLLQ